MLSLKLRLGLSSDHVCYGFPIKIWVLALQARRSRFRFPRGSLGFFIDLVLPAAPWPWGWLSLWSMNTRDFSWGKVGRCVGLTILPLSCADCLEILGTLTFWSRKGLSGAVTGQPDFHLKILIFPMPRHSGTIAVTKGKSVNIEGI